MDSAHKQEVLAKEKVILERRRFRILRELAKGPRRLTNLVDLTGLPSKSIVYHLTILRQAGIVVSNGKMEGRNHMLACRLTDKGTALASEYRLGD